MNREQRERYEQRRTGDTNFCDFHVFRGEIFNEHSGLESWTANNANDANKEKQTIKAFGG